jgi:hypothetical protein
MSTLLEQASLVMIPSGYKEDVVYSQIPTNGNGDLSFTRASNGTRVNSAGLVEVCPWNLAQQSETFDNAIWSKNTGGTSTVTVTANSGIAPNGTTTADRIQLTRDSLGFAQVIQTVTTTTSQSYTFSVYLKSLSGTPTVMFGSFGGTNTQTATLTNEWVRYTWTATSPSTSAFALLMIWGGVGSTSLSADFLAWGYQLVEGSSAKPYFPTTDRLNVPRLTYQNGGGGCPSLLLEPQRTNLLTYSEQFDDAAWTKIQSSVSSNSTTSPDGTTNADTFSANGTTAVHALFRAQSVTSATPYTFTIYAKANTGRYLLVRNMSFATVVRYGIAVDLQNGTVTQTSSTATAPTGTSNSVTSVGNGWYRISVTMNSVDTSYGVIVESSNTGTPTLDAFLDYSYNGSESYYVFGAQLEAGAYPTSYIPTTSASATRVADACGKTGISSLIGQTEGVLFVDLVITGTTGNNRFSISDGSNVNWIFIGTPEDGATRSSRFYIKTNGVVRVDTGTSSYFTIGQRYKLALAYKSGDWAVYANGSLLYSGTDSIGSVSSALSAFDFFNTSGGTADCREQINQAILFPNRLTNAELASLTTI